jgi:hypothetical protein
MTRYTAIVTAILLASLAGNAYQAHRKDEKENVSQTQNNNHMRIVKIC